MNIVEKHITEIMIATGILPGRMGFQYIRDAIIIILINERALYNMKKYIYTELCKKYGKTSNSIQMSIVHSIKMSNNDYTIRELLGILYEKLRIKIEI
jgi:hypothetical protein